MDDGTLETPGNDETLGTLDDGTLETLDDGTLDDGRLETLDNGTALLEDVLLLSDKVTSEDNFLLFPLVGLWLPIPLAVIIPV